MIHVERHARVQSALKVPGDVAVEVSGSRLALAPVDDERDTSRCVLDRNSIPRRQRRHRSKRLCESLRVSIGAMKLRGGKIDWGFVAVLIMVWAYFFPTPSDVSTAFSPSIQRLSRVSEKATNEIVAFLAEPPRIALEPDQVVIPTFPFGQMVVSAPAGWHIAGASQTNSALTTK